MDDEVVLPAVITAPEAGGTATPVEAPVSGEPTPDEPKAPRTFSQEEMDAEIGKRLAREQRKAQRERDRAIAEAVASATKPATPVAAPSGRPPAEKFATTEEWVEAVADWKADQKIEAKLSELDKRGREQSAQRLEQQVAASFAEREDVAREKYADYDEITRNPALPITTAMVATARESEEGCDVLYYLGKNPKEAERIARLSPFLQAKELGKLEVKLASEPAPKKPSSAPAPISPVKPAGGQGMVIDTTDPKSSEKLLAGGNATAWIEAERARQVREAARHR